MKKIINVIKIMLDGFCMALADSVPGVSGGTIAFLLGFYDKFIGSLDDLFRGNLKKKKEALIWLIKLGIGWIIGFAIAATIISSLFNTKTYEMCSLFIGFILLAIPIVIKEEIKNVKGKYINIIFAIIGALIVIGVSILNTSYNFSPNLTNPNILTYVYIFIVASIAITAMVLPGISGSTLLLIFGLYTPIMEMVKNLIHFEFSGLPILIIFGFGVLFGVIIFVRLIKIALEKYRSAVVYFVLGMMIASIYSIIMGPKTLEIPKSSMTLSTFNILYFIIGAIIVYGLEFIKNKTQEK